MARKWREFPKVDLHRHLEGAMRLSTLREVALQAGIKLLTDNLEELANFVQVRQKMTDLKMLLDRFFITQSVLATPSILERVAFEAVEDAHREGIYLLELRYSPGFVCMNHPQLNYDKVHQAILDGIKRAQKLYPVRVGLIAIISRDVGFDDARKTTEFALSNKSTFVGFDLAGDEAAFPASLFTKYFRRIRESGLGITVHAGEAKGARAAESVRDAIRLLGARRIGHGLLIIQDPTVLEYVKRENVVLEICPVSNYLTNAVDRPENHPIRRLMNLGVKVTVNSDDPGLFGTDLTSDYEMLEKFNGFTEQDFKKCNEIAEEASFVGTR